MVKIIILLQIMYKAKGCSSIHKNLNRNLVAQPFEYYLK